MFKGSQVQLLNQCGTRNICVASSIYDRTAHLIVDEAAISTLISQGFDEAKQAIGNVS